MWLQVFQTNFFKMKSSLIILLPMCLLTLLPCSNGIKCFLDTIGIPEPKVDEIVNTTSFRHFDCNLLGGEDKVCLSDFSNLIFFISNIFWLWSYVTPSRQRKKPYIFEYNRVELDKSTFFLLWGLIFLNRLTSCLSSTQSIQFYMSKLVTFTKYAKTNIFVWY